MAWLFQRRVIFSDGTTNLCGIWLVFLKRSIPNGIVSIDTNYGIIKKQCKLIAGWDKTNTGKYNFFRSFILRK